MMLELGLRARKKCWLRMPRFYFEVEKDEVTGDREGVDLPDRMVARAYAVLAARDLACTTIHEGEINLSWRVRVLGEDGAVLFAVALSEAFTIRRGNGS